MNSLEKQMIERLVELRERYHVTGPSGRPPRSGEAEGAGAEAGPDRS